MAAGSPVRVLLVEDHTVVRHGLRLLLEQHGMEVTGEAGSADEAVRAVEELQPDVVVLDVSLPGRSGIDALPELLEASPSTRVLILSMQDEPEYVRRAFAAGARGYVLKEAGDSELLDALREVVEGNHYVDPALGARLAEAESVRREVEEELSEREREVARLLALGHTNQEIAKMLYVSVRTAEAHRSHIMHKLRLRTRAELVRWALDHGLIGRD